MKTKKIGALRREIISPEQKNMQGKVIIKALTGPLFMNDSDLRTELRGKLRMIWRESSRRVFMEEIRRSKVIMGKSKLIVVCTECNLEMGLSEKARLPNAKGVLSKNPKSLYQVDHIEGLPEFTDIEAHLGKYAEALFHGPLRIVCYECHREITKLQRKQKKGKKA